MPTATSQRGWVWGVAKQLREGEEVTLICADTDRTLTVTEAARYAEREPYRSDGLVVELEGYGTEYVLEVPAEKYDRPATLIYPSGDALGELVKDIDRAEGAFGIVAEQTAADMGIPER
jgi:hypothetical protein